MNLYQISHQFAKAHPGITQATANLDTLKAYRAAEAIQGLKQGGIGAALMITGAAAPFTMGPIGWPLAAGGYMGGRYLIDKAEQDLRFDVHKQIRHRHFDKDAPDTPLEKNTVKVLNRFFAPS